MLHYNVDETGAQTPQDKDSLVAIMRKISFKKADKNLQKSIIELKKPLLSSFERVAGKN
jgi:hypothetical protein